MNDLSGIYDLSGIHDYRYQLQHDKPGDFSVLFNGISWLSLTITPWAMIAFIADFIGFLELSVASQITLSVIVACALPQFMKSCSTNIPKP